MPDDIDVSSGTPRNSYRIAEDRRNRLPIRVTKTDLFGGFRKRNENPKIALAARLHPAQINPDYAAMPLLSLRNSVDL